MPQDLLRSLNRSKIRSALWTRAIQLSVAPASQMLTVHASGTLIDPYRAGSVNQIGRTIQSRLTALPGRSIQELVNSQPGWLYEGNAVLHPRGSEYQTQYVIDGIPFTDNRSPGFGPSIEANDIQSMTIYTAGIPAQYGRKMGGVVVVNTLKTKYRECTVSSHCWEAATIRVESTLRTNTHGKEIHWAWARPAT